MDVVKDRIVEISLVKVSPGSDTPEVKTRRIKPLDDRGEVMHIPEEATAVHGITDADVADKPAFRHIAKSLAEYMKGCDLGGFNSSRFDIPMLARADTRIIPSALEQQLPAENTITISSSVFSDGICDYLNTIAKRGTRRHE